MSLTRWLFGRLWIHKERRQDHARPCLDTQFDVMVQAHGDWLALLATILEREKVIAGDELACSLSEFAAVTAADRPAEGRLLSFWAARLQDTAASLHDFPTIH